MKRAEALKHFEEEYINPHSNKMIKDMEKYIDENRKELTVDFVENFRTLCNKIKAMQDEGKKGKIAIILIYTICRRRAGIMLFRHLVRNGFWKKANSAKLIIM